MEMDKDKQKGLDWFVNLNSELRRENQELNFKNKKLETELFFYKKSSEESKETISRILKKNDSNEMSYIFLNESARKFLKYLSEESCKMKEIIKNKDISLNVSSFIEQKIKIEDLQNQIDSRNIEISTLKKQVENNNEVSSLYSKISSLSIENFNLKIELLSKQNAMDYLQTSLKGFQSNLVKIFCDLYKVYGNTLLNKLKSDLIFSECLVPEFSFDDNKNQNLNDELNQCKKVIKDLSNQINLLKDELNQHKKVIEDLSNDKKENEQTLNAVLNEIGNQKVLNNKIQELERQLFFANKDKESFKERCAELNKKLEANQTPVHSNYIPKFSQEPFALSPLNPNNFQRSTLVCDGGTVVRDGAKSAEKQTKNQSLHLSISDSKFDIYRPKDLSHEVVKGQRDVKFTPTSPQKQECVYCCERHPLDELEAHQKLCESRFD
ncbi:putative leucine-rich repeat-containing protein DDB_G0290503 isoform X2 [Hydra vulgaris]|uniref:putative leucine-rich repeat-containing protein DDB_G0290503 isoform X2 n=1 Tax=Hydra vulgaris TaxID=6087 RepID=UPI001F5F8832|nr:putative leucine-rich repeat-containing protein DDB_G0290503 isoform X2 [Hydra vulgaris]